MTAVIAVKNEDMKLKPGMTTIISINVAHRDDVLKLSNAALRYQPPETEAKTTMSGMTGSPGVASSPARPRTAEAGAGSRPPDGKRPGKGGKNMRMERPVYVLRPGAAKPELVQVKVGISDNIWTEALEGLKEGDLAVIGQTGGATSAQSTQSSNPLSGGGARFR